MKEKWKPLVNMGVWAASIWGFWELSHLAFPCHVKHKARIRSNGYCSCCGKDIGKNGDLKVHHVLPESICNQLGLQAEITQSEANSMPLCVDCHREADEESFANPLGAFDLLAEAHPQIAGYRAILEAGLKSLTRGR